MRVVDYKEYNEEKLKFMEEHNFDYTLETSPMNEYGEYHKTYVFADDSQWLEHMRPVYEKTEVVVKGVRVPVEVKLLETEYYSSDDARSRYYYERF